MRILIIEDSLTEIARIRALLSGQGHIVDCETMGESGFEVGRLYDYDIILLDLRLPDRDGLSVLRDLRAEKITTPILILTGVEDIEDRIRGLELGADDFLLKPYNGMELTARIHAVVRRSQGNSSNIITIGNLELDLGRREARLFEKMISLTNKEFEILELLVRRRGIVISKEMVMDHLYGGIDEPDIKIVDVFICKLRKKMQEIGGHDVGKIIRTVWGRGYMIDNSQIEASRTSNHHAA